MGGFERRGAAGEAEGVGSKDSVTCTGDVDGLVAAMDRNVRGGLAGFEESDAVAAAGDEEGLELHGGERGAATAFEFIEILADGGVVEGLHFAFVGGGGVETGAREVCETVAGVESRDEALVAREEFGEFTGDGDAKTVVRHGEGVGFLESRGEFGVDFLADFGGERVGRFVIHAKNLLGDFMGPAGEEAGFRGGGPVFGAEDAGDVKLLRAEEIAEVVAGFVFAYCSNGNDFGPKGGEVVGGVGAAAGNDSRFVMLEDEDRSFAGDTGDISNLEGIGDEIAEDDDGFGGEAFDIVGEGEEVDRGGGGALGQ